MTRHLIQGTAAVALTLVLGTAPALAATPADLRGTGGRVMVVSCVQTGNWLQRGLAGLFTGGACTQAETPAQAAVAGNLAGLLPQRLLSLLGIAGWPAAAPQPVALPQPAALPQPGVVPVTVPQAGAGAPAGTRPPVTIVLPPTYIGVRPRQPAPRPQPQPPQPQPQPPVVNPAPAVPVQPATGGNMTAAEQQMLSLVNTERQRAGLSPLTADAKLTEVARVKCRDMIQGGYFGHDSPTLGSPFDLMRRYGVTYRTAGENIAGNRSVAAAHQALMNSSGHRANILNPAFTRIGIGIVSGGPYGMMFAQEFAG